MCKIVIIKYECRNFLLVLYIQENFVILELVFSYHFDGAEGDDAVTASAVGPGVPARILTLLKHILFPLTAGLLISHPPGPKSE